MVIVVVYFIIVKIVQIIKANLQTLQIQLRKSANVLCFIFCTTQRIKMAHIQNEPHSHYSPTRTKCPQVKLSKIEKNKANCSAKKERQMSLNRAYRINNP